MRPPCDRSWDDGKWWLAADTGGRAYPREGGPPIKREADTSSIPSIHHDNGCFRPTMTKSLLPLTHTSYCSQALGASRSLSFDAVSAPPPTHTHIQDSLRCCGVSYPTPPDRKTRAKVFAVAAFVRLCLGVKSLLTLTSVPVFHHFPAPLPKLPTGPVAVGPEPKQSEDSEASRQAGFRCAGPPSNPCTGCPRLSTQ